jgi:hypothetical protein
MVIKNKHRVWEKLSAIFVIAIFLVAILGNVPEAGATGTLTSMWLFETNMDASPSGSGMLYLAFKAATTAVPGTITVTLGTGTTTAASPTVSTATCAGASGIFGWLNAGAGVTALPTSTSLTGSGGTNAFTVTGATSLTSSTIYCFGLTSANAVTNMSTPGLYSYTVADTSDSGTDYYAVLTTGTSESIGVTTAVTQYFTLTVGGTTQALGSLTTGAIANSSANTATVSSNAMNGVSLFAFDQYAGLYSPSKTTTINSVSPNSASLQTVNNNPTAASFITTVNANGDSQGVPLTITAPFNGAVGSSTTTGDGLSATPAVIGYTSVPTYLANAKIYDSAAINSATPIAADYADTVYVVGSGAY